MEKGASGRPYTQLLSRDGKAVLCTATTSNAENGHPGEQSSKLAVLGEQGEEIASWTAEQWTDLNFAKVGISRNGRYLRFVRSESGRRYVAVVDLSSKRISLVPEDAVTGGRRLYQLAEVGDHGELTDNFLKLNADGSPVTVGGEPVWEPVVYPMFCP